MEKCFLLFFIKKFDYALKKQNANPKKVYVVDTALAERVSFRISEDKGRRMENMVLLELLRRKKEVYYHKKVYECDFVVKQGTSITEVLQVCWSLHQDSKDREVRGLVEAAKTYRLKEGVIVTYDESGEVKSEGVRICFIPLWRWLLEEK